jgi:ferredoxin/flavodoxin
MIFYFSGCGNTRWAAQQIADVQKEKLIFIPQVIDGDCTFTLRDEEKIGILFPVYSWAEPKIITDFIHRLKLENYHGQYLFMVCTCGGNAGLTREVFTASIESRGWHVDSAFSVQMPNTYVCLPGFGTDSPELEEDKLQKAVGRLKYINEQVSQRAGGEYDVVSGIFPWTKTRICQPFFQRFFVNDKPFHTSDKCIDCGICESSCPVGNIRMTDGRPVWLHNCTMCLGCYHHCPPHAIDYGQVTANKGQYVHPEK